MKPKVSILIPVYNSEKYISRCLETVLSQTYDNIEYVIVNDSTPDNSMQIAESIVAKHRRDVKVISHETNKGIAFTRNTLMNNASGDYLLFVDSDDFIAGNAVESLMATAAETGADIVRASYYEYYEDNTKVVHHKPFSSKEELLRQHIAAWNSIEAMWQLLIKRSLVTENNLFFEKGINGPEDYLMTTKLFYHAEKIVSVDEPFYYYRLDNDQSLTHTRRRAFLDAMCKAAEANIRFLKEKDIFGRYKDEALTRMFLCKQNLLLNKEMRDVARYLDFCPESNCYYRRFSYSKSQKLLFFLAEKRMTALLALLLKFV